MCETPRQDPGPRTKRCGAAVWPGPPSGHGHLNACPLPAPQTETLRGSYHWCFLETLSPRESQKLPEGHVERKLPGPEPPSAVPRKPPRSTPQLFALSGFLLTDVWVPLGSAGKACQSSGATSPPWPPSLTDLVTIFFSPVDT